MSPREGRARSRAPVHTMAGRRLNTNGRTTTDLGPLGLARARPVDSPIISSRGHCLSARRPWVPPPIAAAGERREVIVRAPGAAWTGRGLGGLIEARLAPPSGPRKKCAGTPPLRRSGVITAGPLAMFETPTWVSAPCTCRATPAHTRLMLAWSRPCHRAGAYPIGHAVLGRRPVGRALTALVAVAIVGAGAAPHSTAEACDPAWIDYQP